jgi:hypothetical protein
MEKVWQSDSKPISLWVKIICKGKSKFRVCASDFAHKNSNYADRTIECDGERIIYLSFPISPDKLKISIIQVEGKENFMVDIKEKPLKKYDIKVDEQSAKFLKFAGDFCKVSGYSQADPSGRLFQTKDGEFKIKYFPVIIDHRNNKVSSTPARIGHNTGIIEIAKLPFDRYTIPMRMMILLHEYSHKYRNPKLGLPISDEVGADLNALYLYLGVGFSKVDAIYVFCNVFLKAQTPGNMNRMKKIYEYIKRFENQEFATEV